MAKQVLIIVQLRTGHISWCPWAVVYFLVAIISNEKCAVKVGADLH